MFQYLTHYLKLTKPVITLMVGFTALTGAATVQNLSENPAELVWILFLIMLAGIAAGIFNQYFERHLDAQMERTKLKRPLANNLIPPWHALAIALALTFISTFFLGMLDFKAAALSLFTVAFYVCIYTLWIKKTHHYGVVLGGIAGATAPLIASTALSHQWDALPLWLAFLMFMWQPPHFWALSLVLQEDYGRCQFPILPLAKGEPRTKLEIVLYTLTLIPLTFVPSWMNWTGAIYFYVAGLGLMLYLAETFRYIRYAKPPYNKSLFWVSIVYLFLICLGLILDRQIGGF